MSVVKRAQEKIKRWREDPVFFVTDELKGEPDPWQLELLRAFPDPEKRRIAMQACKGVGKTAGLAWCILNFMACYADRGEHPKGAATSITADNIDDNLWPEIAKWQHRSEFMSAAFTWTKSRFFANDHAETWFFSKRTWPKSGDKQQQSNTLAGLHARFLMFVIDESGGVPDAVMAAAEGGLATDKPGHLVKILQAGNPTHREGPLYRAATAERHLWHLIIITGDPDDPNRSQRQSLQWAREQIDKYGRENPWVLVNVFGRFPPSSINSLLGPDEVAQAFLRQHKQSDFIYSQKRLGVDVARFGDDRTTIFPRQGLVAFKPVEIRGARSNEVAARVAMAKAKWGSELELVDGTGGWGSGVIDSLIMAGHAPIEVQFSGKPMDPRYYNKRAEMWFDMAEWVKTRGSLPNMPELQRELTAPTYTFKDGKFLLESKEQIKERLGFSPDLADGLALTFALPEMPGSSPLQAVREKNNFKKEYDPFDPANF
jgi:hypothetical protein